MQDPVFGACSMWHRSRPAPWVYSQLFLPPVTSSIFISHAQDNTVVYYNINMPYTFSVGVIVLLEKI